MTAPAVVLFDLDDTLFAHRAAVDRGIADHLAALGAPYASADAAETAALWHALEEEYYHRYLAGTLDFAGQRSGRARAFTAAHGIELDEAASAAWFDAYFEHYVDNWVLHDDALPCLDRLERDIPGVRIGLVTNGELAYQSRKVRNVGLDTRVEHVIASGAFGATKPDAAIFHHACDTFGVPTASAVYIGDRLRTDAIGAAEAGLRGIWINRTHRPMTDAEARDTRAAGVAEIYDLAELPPLL